MRWCTLQPPLASIYSICSVLCAVLYVEQTFTMAWLAKQQELPFGECYFKYSMNDLPLDRMREAPMGR